ncbi:hypothetical protein BS17DRAFT_776235 [Gyrodon lividus]|nr:hypothetical protein BS17DRAFT_776235 [Gyrodon lividus]
MTKCFHSMLRVNYTTYDLRREQDTINPLTRADCVMYFAISFFCKFCDAVHPGKLSSRASRMEHDNMTMYIM